ncbi:MAG: DUF4339 domain-containing protein [Saprospirales bacterium]|nr:MAG: DUF4339 domain-containing protein [Saprospirales bacterium]
MKRFFYSDGENQFGPFTIEELKEKPIKPDTLIWYQGLEEWTAASDAALIKEELGFVKKPVVELSDEELEQQMQEMIPASIPESKLDGHFKKMPYPWLVESILLTIFCCQPLGIVAIIYAAQVESKFTKGDYEGAKKASDNAALFTKIGLFLTAGFVLFYFIIALGAGM